MFLAIFELFIVAVVVTVFFTQIFWPMFKGRQAFPWFRRQGYLEARLAERTQRKHNQEIKDVDRT